ncbi:MAG: hypothetical protein ACFB6S_06915 [Geminicoccaceae bacterium]
MQIPEPFDSNTEPIPFGDLRDALIQSGLASLLQDRELAGRFIHAVHEQTGIPKAVIGASVSLLAPLLMNAASYIGRAAGRKAAVALGRTLERLPYYAELSNRLKDLCQDEVERRRLKEAIEGVAVGDAVDKDLLTNDLLGQDTRLLLRSLEDHEEILDRLGDIGDQLDRIREDLRPQPFLRTVHGQFADPETDRLHFSSQRVTFHGRRDELARLIDFLRVERAFAWWLVTGPGGMGKSRLAFEFCRRTPTAWRAGFLVASATSFDWQRWQPEKPTLLVIDYVQGRIEEIRDLLVALAGRTDDSEQPLSWPVRVLLVEREQTKDWWLRLFPLEGGRLTKASYFGGSTDDPNNALALTPLDSSQLYDLMVEVVGPDATLPSEDETLSELERLDPKRRALFAIMAAEAYAENDSFPFTEKELLTERVIRELKLIWPNDGAMSDQQRVREQNLWCLTTMVGGLPVVLLDHVKKTAYGFRFPSAEPERDDGLSAVAWHRLSTTIPAEQTGHESIQTIAPMQPDILGEWFVIRHLTADRPNTSKLRRELATIAWGLPPPRPSISSSLSIACA